MEKIKKQLIIKILFETIFLIFTIIILSKSSYQKEIDYDFIAKGIGVVILYSSLLYIDMKKYNKIKKELLMQEYSENKYCEICKDYISDEQCFKNIELFEYMEKYKIISYFLIKNRK